MSGDNAASNNDRRAIFTKLRSLPENKSCFDCNKSNPTWCTIPFGAFVCLDCSGVHRSLGTHLTFIRSSDLDQSWTWKQLRCMQVGGNAKARAFFRANGGETADLSKKYNAKAAMLYKGKIQKLAADALIKFQGVLHITNSGTAESNEPKKDRHDDFFSKFDNIELKQEAPLPAKAEYTEVPRKEPKVAAVENGNGLDKLTVNLEENLVVNPVKPAVKIAKLGAKKGGKKSAFGGAKKVAKSDFKATAAAAEREEKEEKTVIKIETGDSNLSTEAAARLTYKQIERDQKKNVQNMSSHKAESASRLGMGLGGMRVVSHNSDFEDIRQVEASTKLQEPSFLDNEESIGNFSRRNEECDDLSDLMGPKKTFGNDNVMERKNERGMFNKTEESNSKYGSTRQNDTSAKSLSGDKYKNSKAISSQDLFGDEPDTNGDTPSSRLNNFKGSQSVGSADLFGDGGSQTTNASSVRDSATNLASNVGNMAGNALSAGWNAFNQIKENYA